MPARVLWSVLLALVAWIPVERAQPHAPRLDRSDRVVHAASALDAADGASRVADCQRLPRQLARLTDRPPHAPAPHRSGAALRVVVAPPPAWRPAVAPRPTGWRGFLHEQLTLPHDANAPPARRS